MDKIDKEIFEHLLHNSRLTSAEIAKQIKAPRHVVAYRKDQLFKKKIITGTDVLINFGAFGYQEFIVYLKLFRYSEIKDKIKDFMENHPNARWAGEVFPNYNLRLVFLAKTLEEFELVMAELEAVCKERIVAQEVLFGRDLLKKRDYSTKLHSKEIQKYPEMKITSVDKKLLTAVINKSDATLLELAQKSDLSIEGVRQKLKEYKERGVISRFTVSFDKKKLGINFWGQLFLRVNNLESHLSKLKPFLYTHNHFGRSRKLFGHWNLELTLLVGAYDEMVKVLNDLEIFFEQGLEDYMLTVTTKVLVVKRTLPMLFS